MAGDGAELHVTGLLRSTASWAKFARELTRALLTRGVAVTAEDWPEAPFHDPAMVLDSALERALRSRPRAATTLAFVAPDEYPALSVDPARLWGFVVYEADRWPESWLRALNDVAGIVVPSRFCADALVSTGVPEEKVVVVPPGVDTTVFCPEGRPVPVPGERFRLLFVGTSARRKGLDLLLAAFGSAFVPADDVSLTVKTTHYPDAAERSYVDGTWWDRVQELRSQRYDVQVIASGFDEDELADLFRAHHMLCLPTRGEGSVSLSMLEGMACGTPVLTVLVPGIREIAETRGARLLQPSRSVPAVTVLPDFGGADPRAVVSEVSPQALAADLRWAYRHRADIRRMESAAAREAAGWTWDHAARALCRGLGLARGAG